MEPWLNDQLTQLLAALALPQFGLSTLFVISLLSATLLPMGSEPAVIALVELNRSMFWPAVGVATLGNTLGGAITWWLGMSTHQAVNKLRQTPADSHGRATAWLLQFGPKACLLSWLPIVGDPLCAVAGWLRLPFWPCVFFMAIGKFARYLTMTGLWLAARAMAGA